MIVFDAAKQSFLKIGIGKLISDGLVPVQQLSFSKVVGLGAPHRNLVLLVINFHLSGYKGKLQKLLVEFLEILGRNYLKFATCRYQFAKGLHDQNILIFHTSYFAHKKVQRVFDSGKNRENFGASLTQNWATS